LGKRSESTDLDDLIIGPDLGGKRLKDSDGLSFRDRPRAAKEGELVRQVERELCRPLMLSKVLECRR
jgi:hypothetical protein